jgi:hypothetical protein
VVLVGSGIVGSGVVGSGVVGSGVVGSGVVGSAVVGSAVVGSAVVGTVVVGCAVVGCGTGCVGAGTVVLGGEVDTALGTGPADGVLAAARVAGAEVGVGAGSTARSLARPPEPTRKATLVRAARPCARKYETHSTTADW